MDELLARAIEQSLTDEQADHVDPPGSPLHTHAEPGSAGDVLAKALEESLADEDFTIGGGYMESADSHGQSEGLTLSGGETEESVYSGAQCDPDAPLRRYDVVAINVEITLNRFLDYDPEGRMYVLEDELSRVRIEETQNRAARADIAQPAVSIGLQDDAIQPLTIRANQGECVRIVLSNALNENEPASLHVHGSSIYVADTGAPAIATNPDATILPGQSVTYEWMIAENEQEGVHYFHSHGIDRFQAGHGLFGGIVVERGGSIYEDPIQGTPLASGWSAMIRYPDGSDFREFAIYYHEIGSERYRHRDKTGELVTFVDPYTGAYKPGGRALKFYASVRLDIRRIETLKDGSDAVGNRTRVKIVKNKMAPPFKQAEFDILYGVGISREGSLIDFGVEHGIVKKSGAWYTYDGEQLGQGKENARNFLIKNADIAADIETKIKEKLGIGQPRVEASADELAARRPA